MRVRPRILLLFASLAILVMGCTGAVAQDSTGIGLEEPFPTDTPGDSGEPRAKPTPRSAFEATDPATVNLASGQLQLVEFFAFW